MKINKICKLISAIVLIACLTTQTVSAIPTITATAPVNNTGVACPPCAYLSVNVTHENGTAMNITFCSNLSGVWDYFYIGTLNTTIPNVNNGSYNINIVYVTEYNSTYYWYVNVSNFDDPSNYTKSGIFNFNTTSEIATCNSTLGDVGMTYAWIVGIAVVFSSFGVLAYLKRRQK